MSAGTMFACPACAKQLPKTPEAGTPCPQCGAEMVPEKPPELDPTWVAEKAAKQAAATEAAAPKPSRMMAVILLSGVMVAIVAAIVLIVMQRQPTAKGEALEGVEITVTAPKPGTPFTLDGLKAGRTPQSLKIKGSRTKPLVLRGNGVEKIITPDRDQTVNLAP